MKDDKLLTGMTFNSTLLRMINSQNSQIYKESSYQGWGNGEMENQCLVALVSVWGNEKVLDMDGGNGHTTV